MGKYRTSEILREWAIGERERAACSVAIAILCVLDKILFIRLSGLSADILFLFHFFLYFIWFLFKFTKLIKQEPSLTFYFILSKIRVLLNIMR